jgi:hypothetical protein
MSRVPARRIPAAAQAPAVVAISRDGLALLVNRRECFISFAEFPALLLGSVEDIQNVLQPEPDILHWPALGLDIPVDFLQPTKNTPVNN